MLPGHDTLKVIHHHHLEEGIKDVIAGKRVMQQSLFTDATQSPLAVMERMRADSPQTTVYALALAGAALLVALAALLAVVLR